MSDFHSLEAVGCGSETQLQVSENLNKYNYQDRSRLYSHVTLHNYPFCVHLHTSNNNNMFNFIYFI